MQRPFTLQAAGGVDPERDTALALLLPGATEPCDLAADLRRIVGPAPGRNR